VSSATENANIQVDNIVKWIFIGNTGVVEACLNNGVISRYTVIVPVRSSGCRQRIATYKSKTMLSPTLALSDEGEKLMLSFAPTNTVKVAGLAVDDVLALDSERVVVEGLAVAITVTILVAVAMIMDVASSVTIPSSGIMSAAAEMSAGRMGVG
jgi:hypothetical protein